MDINLHFNESWKNIAISVSGGADSALLSYLICNLSKDHDIKIHIISHTRMWKTRPWQQHDSEQIYNWLTKRFPTINFFRHTNFIAPELEYGFIGPSLIDEYGKKVSGDNIQQRAFAEFICHKYNVDAYYNGVTRNPRDVNLNGMTERDVEKTEKNIHLEVMHHMDKVAIHPFRFIDKAKIIQTYIDLDLLDLLKITRSCEGEFLGIDYKTYQLGEHIPLCGQCFWCKEREWALRSNGITQEKYL